MLTPKAILDIYNSYVQTKNERTIANITGIYIDQNRSNYSGFYYDRLKDESTDFEMTLLVPERIKPQLTSNKLISFKGYVTKKISKRGSIDLQINLMELEKQEESQYSADDIKKIEIIRNKADKGLKDVELLIKSAITEERSISIIAVTGLGAITDADWKDQMKTFPDTYNIKEVRTSFGDAGNILQQMKKLDDFENDIVCLFRGGGGGLEVFDDIELASYLVDYKPCLISALGHKKDVTLVEQIADKKLATPSAFGAYLSDTYESIKRDVANSEAAITSKIKKQLDNNYLKMIKEIESSKNLLSTQLKKSKEDNIALQNHNANQLKLVSKGHEDAMKSIALQQSRSEQQLNNQIKNLDTSLKESQASLRESQTQMQANVQALQTTQLRLQEVSTQLKTASNKTYTYSVIALIIGFILALILIN